MIVIKLEDFEKHRSNLLRYAIGLLRTRGFSNHKQGELDELAKDIVQNTYLEFQTSNLNTFVTDQHFTSFLKLSLYHCYQKEVDFRRKGAQWILFKQGEFDQLDINKISPTTAIDRIRDFEAQGHNLQNVGDNPYNPQIALQQKGAAYLAAAEELKKQLNKFSVSPDAVEALKTPENIAAFEKISPRLAQQFKDAKSLNDLRAFQSRYVTLMQAIDMTENASQSPFVQLAKSLGTRLGGGVTGGAFGGIPGAVIGTIVGPTLEGAIEARLPQIQSKISQFINKAGLPSVPKK